MSRVTGTASTHRAVEAVWRIEAARLVAGLAHLTRDVGLAEDLAQEALLAALEQWPSEGVPRNPGAWLMAVGKRRAVDTFRRQERRDRKHAELGREQGRRASGDDPALSAVLEDDIEDDLLRLVFTACHPVLSTEARVALALKVLCGLSTTEIARAFLVPEPTIAQRVVRAKRALAAKGVPFEVPPAHERPARLASVLEVVYLVFNEGYSATAGEDWLRPELCAEAMRLGRVLAGLMPDEPEVHGLVALMELQASRTRARTAADGTPVLLLDQDRGRWDQLLVGRGLTGLERAEALSAGVSGPYTLQAAIAACHARARTAGETDWDRIAALYAVLVAVQPSPVVELNRAVAVSMAHGPAPALEIVDALAATGTLGRYHLLPAVRADLLVRLGRQAEARVELEHAATLTQNERERTLLLQRAAACG
ncbi:RNA polymerase sigma factor [Oryzihumus sp.]